MKAEVLREYEDRHTGNLHKPNEILEMTEERYQEINGTAHGIFVKEIAEPRLTKKAAKKAGD